MQSYTLLDLAEKLDKTLLEIRVLKNKGKIKLVGCIAGVAYYKLTGEKND